ncbi:MULTISPECIES: gluconate 2-dehydrogenase subunit 3 family protein [Pseudomonas]|uniref:Gluconate 2-dehydrogenase n=1 Tax=Pseudomonas putida TaxID=303 RepID=A0A1L7NBZ8_PSEPU|nr:MULTISPECIES: gluconate 2-dehydrogenase subunit 3 family protein [Pseudomonas]PNB62218.1 gluconate 2-dehydrogenase [Pseudomonas sp. FW305-130]MBP2083698.1 gluconate 2-dehydrogenase gamma chain [Pseudomonas sp. PvP089]MBP2090599.1 gluconate 2-dehydrogenase gamma chain [Pseudomonas sp. PvP088]MBP2223237.1 gluconate 2-dehydrogenase gamma chain [Pseudomonas putida]PMY83256.1 gluconate 2-dehydrogenase [Pseudomonas sp. FW306-2-2C-D06B]
MSDTPNARRRFLQGGLALIPLVTLASHGVPTAFGDTPRQPATPQLQPDDYRPRFFTDVEWAFVQAACERLIPTDELGPGAIACGIPGFIDRQMDTPYGHGALFYSQGPFITDQLPELGYQGRLAPRDILRLGIAGCDQWCRQTHGQPFAGLASLMQAQVLHLLEEGEVPLEALPSSQFFNQLLRNTREGYFADPVYGGNRDMAGWKMIGFPGARADFMDWIDHPGERYPLGPVSISGQRG